MLRPLSLVGILIVIVTVAFLATKSLTSLSANGNPKSSVDQAGSVKEEADLKAVETKLETYFAQHQTYPQNLADLDNFGVNLSEFNYNYCSSTLVSVKTAVGKKVVLENGGETSSESC